MKRKRGKLLLQVGAVILTVFLVIMFVAHRYVFMKGTELFLYAKNEMIENDLRVTANDFNQTLNDSIVDYCIEHPEVIDYEYSEEDYEVINYFQYDSKTFDEMTEEVKRANAVNKLSNVEYSLAENVYSKGYSDSYCLKLLEGDKAVVIFDDRYADEVYRFNQESNPKASFSGADNAGNKAQYKYKLGDVIDFDTSEIGQLDDIIKSKSNSAAFDKVIDGQKAYYIGYYPVYDENDELDYLICVEYDFSDVYSDLIEEAIMHVAMNIFIGLLFALGVILICLYIITIKPLRQVKEAIDGYMITKNSGDVEKSLSQVKANNEIGALSDDFVDLAREIDRYTEENISLATESAKVKTELDLAASIQRQALIDKFPDSDRYEVFASMTPAKEVGGDFYDIFEIDESHVGFVIADVSGKGMPAALLMMSAMTSIRNNALLGGKPSAIISRVNEDLCNRDIMGMFVTIWLGILDVQTGLLVSSNAGHEYPALNATGRYEMVRDKHGLVAGGFSGIKYTDFEIQLKKGDLLFVYTDGVPEATNADSKMFGEARMVEALNIKPDASPEELLQIIQDSVNEFVGDAEQFDDLTMLCIKYNG